MEASLFECPACQQDYDLSKRLPRILSVCGHLICSSCLTQILSHKDRPPRCPLNCSDLPKKNLDEFHVCSVVRQILENRSKNEMFQKHNNKQRSLIRLNEKEKISTKRLESHLKEDHQIRELDSGRKKANESIQNIKQLVKDVKTFHQDIEKGIDNIRQKYIKDLNDGFEDFLFRIDKKKEELIEEINCYFKSQKIKINGLLGESSELFRDLTEKELKLGNIFNHEDLLSDSKVFNKIQKQIDKLKLTINRKEIDKMFRDKLEKDNQAFNDNFVSAQNRFLSEIHLNDLKSYNYYQIISNELSDDMNNLRVKSFLNFNLISNCLEISTVSEHEEILVEMNKWSKANQVKLSLDQALSEEDVNLLSRIWKRLRAIKSLDFKFYSGTVSKTLTDMFNEGINAYSSISINIGQYDANEYPEVLLLFKNILSKANNLDYLALEASEAEFPVDTLKDIFKPGFFFGKKLKYFKLDLEKTNVTDEDIEHLFVRMPFLQSFVLDLSETKITDKVIEICGKNTLSTTDKLKELRLDFGGLAITDDGVDFVLKNFENLTHLELFLGETQITDKAIELLSQRMSNKFKDLVEFQLDMANTKVSDNCFSSLFRPMPKLQKFGIALFNTNITDKTLDLLVQKTLISISKPLVYLQLMLDGTNCTDKSVSELLKNLNDVENLSLCLECERITDVSLAPFVQEKLPQMESLKQLELDVLDDSISQKIKDKINALKRRINGQ